MKQKNLVFIYLIAVFLINIQTLSAEYVCIRIQDPAPEIFSWAESQNIDHSFHSISGSLEIYLDEDMLLDPIFSVLEYEIIITESEISRNLEGYRLYQDVLSELNEIAANPAYQSFTHMYSLGPSQGHLYYDDGNTNYQDYQHQVWCLKLSDNPQVNEDEPNVFLAATIHAREPISLEVDMHIIYYLVENYGIIDSVTAWIDSMQIWMIPLVNPDGHKLSVEELHTMHRKNIRDNNLNGNVDYSTVDGVDLNRNFDFSWNGPYSSQSYNHVTYRGPYPWSEPETVYLRDLLQQHKFYGGITYHSYGQVVLYPLGHEPGANSCDHLAMADLADEMASTIPLIQGGGYYNSTQASVGYLASGSMGDWGYGVERIYSYTVELGTTFYPPSYQIEQICEDNLQAALIMIDRINYATVTGNITNGDESLIAEVYVDGIDNVPGMSIVEPVRSGINFGRYYRVLLPGSYTFTFHHPEYGDRIYENVIVLNDEVTVLNVDYAINFVSDISIWIIDGIIHLEWELEPDTDYEVFSSAEPYSGFQVDTDGSYISTNIWEKSAIAEKQYYKVKKTAQ